MGSAKAAANLVQHGVSFEAAATAFLDPLAKIHDDPGHSASERRDIKAQVAWGEPAVQQPVATDETGASKEASRLSQREPLAAWVWRAILDP